MELTAPTTTHSGIYLIRNQITNTVYIGSAVNFSRRFSGHISSLRRNGHHNSRLQRAWLKHGEDAFSFSVLLVCDKQDLIFFEQRSIDVFLAFLGRSALYNACLTALVPSDEARMRMSKAQKGVPKSAEHRAKIGAKSRGRIKTPNERAKISAALLGRALSPDHVSKIRAGGGYKGSKKGRRLSQPTRAKMSSSHTGRRRESPFSDEARAKMSAAKKGKPLPLAHRAHLSAALKGKGKGKVLTEEHKRKISAALTGQKRSAESVEKTAAQLRGRKRPDEIVQKIARANIGKHYHVTSPETREKISAALKGRRMREETKSLMP